MNAEPQTGGTASRGNNRDEDGTTGPASRPPREAQPHAESRDAIGTDEKQWMKSATITAERELEDQLYATAREILGPTATDAEVQALADQEYYGPELPQQKETAEERKQWEEDLERQRAQVRRWGLPNP